MLVLKPPPLDDFQEVIYWACDNTAVVAAFERDTGLYFSDEGTKHDYAFINWLIYNVKIEGW